MCDLVVYLKFGIADVPGEVRGRASVLGDALHLHHVVLAGELLDERAVDPHVVEAQVNIGGSHRNRDRHDSGSGGELLCPGILAGDRALPVAVVLVLDVLDLDATTLRVVVQSCYPSGLVAVRRKNQSLVNNVTTHWIKSNDTHLAPANMTKLFPVGVRNEQPLTSDSALQTRSTSSPRLTSNLDLLGVTLNECTPGKNREKMEF